MATFFAAMVGIRQFDEDKVLADALDLFWRKGLRATSMPDLAAATGVQRGSLYNAFGGKEDLFLLAFDRYAARFLETARKSLDAPAADVALARFLDAALELALGQDPDTGLATWVSAMFRAIEDRRNLAAVLLGEVPFLFEVPAVQALSRNPIKLAVRGRALGGSTSRAEHADALSRLLPAMVSSAVIQSVLWPPTAVRRSDLEQALFRILRPVVVNSGA
jgi:AcrR family transcriptional regulator